VTRASALVRGSVMHARNDEQIRRAFRYPVYVASIDLAELPALERELRLFSHGGRNLFALHDGDYEGGALGLPAAIADLCAGNRLPAPHATRLITNLRVFGYVFNPVSFFLNYDAGGAITSVIAEVNNTYGGRRRYVLGPDQRIADGDRVGFRHVRELFVSPFLHGPASYDFWFDAPLDGDRLAITMHVARPAPQGEPSPQGDSPQGGPSPQGDSPQGGPSPQGDSDPCFAADRNRSVRLGSDPCFAADRNRSARLGSDPCFAADRNRSVRLGSDPCFAADRNRSARLGSGERIFVARLAGTRQPLTDRALLAAAVRYPLMTVQVIGKIHLEAVKLRLRGVPYVRPGPDHRPRPIAPAIRTRSSEVPAKDPPRPLK